MKKTIISLSTIALLAFGCQKEKKQIVSPSQSETTVSTQNGANQKVALTYVLTASSIGDIHNQYMRNFISAVTADMKSKGGFDSFQTIDMQNIYKDEVLADFSSSATSNVSICTFAQNQFTIQLAHTPYDINLHNKNIVNNATHVSALFKTIAIGLIDDATAPGAERNVATIKAKYKKLVLDNQASLTDEEIGIIKAGVSTMEYSFSYWTNEHAVWVNTLDDTFQGVYAGGGGLGDGIGGADVGGCVAGGVYGALIGGTVTIGAGAAPGWLVGALAGGISASIGKGAENLWNHYF